MSLQLIEHEIRQSLATTEPEVICIKGHWGVGKTFAWKRYLEQARARKHGIALRHYAYVSLFGITSLEEFKYAIFENTVGTNGIGVEPSLETLRSHTMEVVKTLGKRTALPLLQQLPIARSYAGGVAPILSFMAVRDTIVCVDDIERRGEKLSLRDVLGLVSNLKEQRRCKVILILNDDAEDREIQQLHTYFEKVVDKALKYAPTAAECVEIALTSETAVRSLLRENCITLGISNIRVLKRVENLVLTVEPLLKEFDDGVMRQAVQSIVLLGWCVYEPKNAPSLEFLEKRPAIRVGTDDAKPLTDSEAAWNALLNVYGFYEVDDFDKALLDGIRNGYFDPELVRRCAAPLDKRCKAGNAESKVTEAWSLYHDSYDDNEDEMADAIFRATFDNIEYVSPIHLNSTVVLLKDIGRTDQAQELIEHYVVSRRDRPALFDLKQYPFGDEITDEDIKITFRKQAEACRLDREPSSILLTIFEQRGWKPEDIAFLVQVPVDVYYSMIKTHRGDTLTKLLDACLQFDRIGGVDEQTKEISRRAKAALLRIGMETRLNARRVRQYGVVVPVPEPGNQE